MEVEEDGCPEGVEEELDREEDEAGLAKSRFRADIGVRQTNQVAIAMKP